ncbi:MAG: hypothetical protein ACD_64C00014G0004 [uncultured bacterium]|nr:MAG: hypothetical protein ACD_64C00014G0004 [uncultured bacterium]
MNKGLTLTIKSIASFIAISIVSILIVGVGGFFSAKKSMQQATFHALAAIRESKKQQIETYFDQIRNQCQTFAQDLMIIDAMKDFKKGFDTIAQQLNYSPEQIAEYTQNLKTYYQKEYLPRLNANIETAETIQDYFAQMPEVTKLLQYLYISHNPNPVGQKENLNTAKDGSDYSKVHEKYHPAIREYLKKFKYYDIFLLDIQSGSIVYSCYKEVDFSTSLATGPFKKTNIASLFRDVQEAQKIDFVRLVDFKFYDPSYGKPASFIGAPIYDQGKKIGVLIFQIPIDQIDKITMNDRKWAETGLGNTGETYLIGSDYKMRTNSRFLVENPDAYFTTLEKIGTPKNIIDKLRLLKSTILVQEINTTASREVVRGSTNTIFDEGYLNVPVISAFTPANLKDFNWGLLVEINQSETLQPIHSLLWSFLLWSLGALILVVLFGLLFSRYITHSKS